MRPFGLCSSQHIFPSVDASFCGYITFFWKLERKQHKSCWSHLYVYMTHTIKYFSFLTLKKDQLYYRLYPCNCDECCKYRWAKCLQLDQCGKYYGPHKFKSDVRYIYSTPPAPRTNAINNRLHNTNHVDSYTQNRQSASDYYDIIHFQPHR